MCATRVDWDEIRLLLIDGLRARQKDSNSGHVTILKGNFRRHTRSTRASRYLVRSKEVDIEREDAERPFTTI